MEKRKILLVTSGFPFGNTERGFLTTEFQYLVEAFDVSILSIGSKEPLLYPFPESVPVERFAYPSFIGTPAGIFRLLANFFHPQVLQEAWQASKGQSVSMALRRYKQIIAYRCNAAAIAERIEACILAGKAELIYTYWCTEATLAGALLKKKYPNIRLLTRFHGHDLFHSRKPTGWQPFRHLIGKNADELTFACTAGLNYFLATWGECYREKSTLRYLGCAPSELPPKSVSNTLRLVSCSNLIPLKRVECIIEGISRIPQDISVRWDHFGDGPERAALEARAAKLLGSNVSWEFHGHVPNQQIGDWYRKLDPDLFLTTSSTEGGVPVSIQEAFSMGIPAIGTDVGGIPDLIVSGETGYLIPDKDCSGALSDAILDFVRLSPAQKGALSNGAYRLWADKFNAERNSASLMQALTCLLGN